ncbi:peptidase U32 family protein [Fervidibacillus halotolerans]|uniref:U32 family peptidase n=1 Tax=Fervidibacillus halotolerans TaxID=2980027 RepID=A0A9E8LY37_9BACI|nr:peptidase U32 family protein [Fervidibacillus halotolerans]WAA11542.1 U32 family peptidase [Fervidibacillus halotolerans]
MKKPELLVTPSSVEEIPWLIDAGADAFVVGEMEYGLRLAGEFTRDQVKESVRLAHDSGKKIYVAMNGIFHNEKVDNLLDYMQFLNEVNVDAALFGDPAVLITAREVAPNMKLHWNPETTATNWYTCNYWGRKGAKRAVLARELSMDEVIEIKEHAEVEIEVQIHGMTCMFQSKRRLIGNYFEFLGRKMEVREKQEGGSLYLFDPERNNRYPIFEDQNGTHIMSPKDICIIDELGDLIDAGIDSFKIDGIFKSVEYNVTVTELYRKAIDMYVNDPEQYEQNKEALLKEIENIQPKDRPLDTGFFFKETVY